MSAQQEIFHSVESPIVDPLCTIAGAFSIRRLSEIENKKGQYGLNNKENGKRSRGKDPRPKFFAVDFFCGAGGTTCGLIDAGGYVIAGVDKDARCERTYVENNTNASIDLGPTRFLNFDIFPRSTDYVAGKQRQLFRELDKLIPYYRGKAPGVPLLFAICAPCQPFTKLSRKQMSDERLERRARDINLLREASRFVRKYQPELVLSENVAGIDDPKYGGIWDDFRTALERIGHATGYKVACTSRFGIPQFRKRSILMAVRRDCVRSERFADILEQELLVPEADPNATSVRLQRRSDICRRWGRRNSCDRPEPQAPRA